MFALGRFIANTGDRSDQANQIDFGVAMTLTQLSQDGSPLVRKVCTCMYTTSNSFVKHASERSSDRLIKQK